MLEEIDGQCESLRSQTSGLQQIQKVKSRATQKTPKPDGKKREFVFRDPQTIQIEILKEKPVKTFEGVPQECIVSSNKGYVCCTNQQGESFVYQITPDVSLKPCLKFDTKVKLFDVQHDRIICDDKVFRISTEPSVKLIQNLQKINECVSVLALGSDALLFGCKNYQNIEYLKFQGTE